MKHKKIVLGVFLLGGLFQPSWAQTNPSPVEVLNGIGYQWYTHPTTQFKTPQIVSGLPHNAISSFNKRMSDILKERLEEVSLCQEESGGTYDYSAETTFEFLSQALISVSLLDRSNCGDTAHDSVYLRYETFNAQTGERLTLGDFIPKNQVYSILTKHYPLEIFTPEGDCDYSDPLIWQDADWAISSDGIKVFPQLPDSMMACGGPEWAVIPWDALK